MPRQRMTVFDVSILTRDPEVARLGSYDLLSGGSRLVLGEKSRSHTKKIDIYKENVGSELHKKKK